jgi:hypothetical protein
MSNPLHCVNPYYYILIRETFDPRMNHQLEIFQQEFIRKTPGHSQAISEIVNEEKICELLTHVDRGVIGRKQLHPKFIRSSCEKSNIVIYLQRNDNPGRLPELVKTLGFLTAKVRGNNTLELELIGTSIIYKGCGSNLINTFFQSARNAEFEHCYLYTLLSPFQFYQKIGMTYLGHTRGNNNTAPKDYMTIHLQGNHIQDVDLSSIIFDPPKPDTTYTVPEHKRLTAFTSPNEPYGNLQPENLNRLDQLMPLRRTAKLGRYLTKNNYHKRSSSSGRGRKRFKKAIYKVLTKIKSNKKK